MDRPRTIHGYSVLLFILACLLVTVIQLGIHYLMPMNYRGCSTVLAYYTFRDPLSGKGNSDSFDVVLPALLLGSLTGIIASGWSTGKKCIFLCIGSILLCLLLPIYPLIVGAKLTWWWPAAKMDSALFTLCEFYKVFLVELFGMLWVGVLFFRKGRQLAKG